MAEHLPLAGGQVTGFGATHRTDNWKTGPAITLFGLLAFLVYVNWALFRAEH